MPAVRTPGAPQPTRLVAALGFCLPLGETGSATPITFDFGAIFPFTCVPAYNLLVYASQWLLPDTTQDSVRGCPAQALPRSPSQATELNALARRNSPQNRACELPRTRLKPPRQGKRSPAARSTRSWFRLAGGFRHPSFGLFSLRRLTPPSVEATRLIAPLRPAGSLHPFRLGIPARAALSPPLQRSLRFLRHPLPPPPSPSLRLEYRRVAGRVGLILLSNVERRMGRLRPIVRRVLVPPSSRVPLDDPTRMPFWPRPVSTFGRLSITDLDNGRSLAFSLPSSAGPLPDWCSQIRAVVPGASYVGLLLRMSG
jgi:hypothetical protein